MNRAIPVLLVAGLVAVGITVAACGAGAASRSGYGRAALPPQCPAKGPARVAANSWAPAKKQLAPAGASAIRLCRYGGLNARPRLALKRATLLTSRAQVGKLVRQFDKLPRFSRGAVACPMDDASQIVALLAYPAGRQITISVGLTGCETVTNGDLSRTALGFGRPRQFGPELLSELARLSGQSGQG